MFWAHIIVLAPWYKFGRARHPTRAYPVMRTVFFFTDAIVTQTTEPSVVT